MEKLEPNTVYVTKENEAYIRIQTEPSILQELHSHFTFDVPGARFTPKFKARMWDGKISLIHIKKGGTSDIAVGQLTYGLIDELEIVCHSCNYRVVRRGFPEYDFDEQTLIKNINNLITDLNIHSKGVKINPYDFQIKAVLEALKTGRKLIVSSTACHPAGTKVVMFDGSMKNVEDIKIGDILMGPDGTKRNVLKLHDGIDEIYKIKPYSGKPFLVNENHILSLNYTPERKKYSKSRIVNISVKEYLQKSNRFKHITKLYYNNKEITFSKCNKKHILDPYFVGLLLGDGSLQKSISLTTMDEEIKCEIYRQAKINNTDVRVCIKKNKNGKINKTKTYYFTNHSAWKENKILNKCRQIGIYNQICGDKFIPDNYKYSDIECRKQILAGLIDTDGWLEDHTNFGFCSKSKQLRDDVSFIARSLGLMVTEVSKLNKKYNIWYHYSCICGDIYKIPVRIKRKTLIKLTRKSPYRTGFKIERIGKDNYYGFELDKDHLYLLDNFLVTHNSGKSLIIYILFMYLLIYSQHKILLVVPTTSLVEQMYTDFADYASEIKWTVESFCHRLYQGKSKTTDKRIVISTWQSIYNQSPEWFEQFGAIVGDEAHGFAAKSLIQIMTNLVNCKIRIGTTGTIQDTKVHHLVLQGLFGGIYVASTTKELQDRNIISPILVKGVILNYKPETCKKLVRIDYDTEMKFLEKHKARNSFICNLLMEIKGNTLVLFKHLDHGKLLFDELTNKCNKVQNDRKLFYICGSGKNKTETEDREIIRKLMDTEDDAVIFATFGTFKQGININRLMNTMYSIPIKSPITTRQSIGRGLRKSSDKYRLCHYDILDNLCSGKYQNHAWKQGIYRLGLYTQDQFPQKYFKYSI